PHRRDGAGRHDRRRARGPGRHLGPAARTSRRHLRRDGARDAGAPARPPPARPHLRWTGRDRGRQLDHRRPAETPGPDRRARKHADHERRAHVTETVARPGTGVVDPITTEIIRNAFVSCAQDMNATLIRSSYTPIIYEGKDCSVAILDEDGNVLGQSLG